MANKGRKPQKTVLKEVFLSDIFSKVISMVEDGYNIYEALEKLNIDSSSFYRNISKHQKSELQMVKTLNTKFGVGKWRSWKLNHSK
jgi:hypothetical protein